MIQIVRLATAFALCATLLVPASARATNFLIPGKIHIIKDTKLTKLVAKPTGTFTIPGIGSAGDPTINGGNLTVIDIGDGIGLNAALPAQAAPLGWKGLGSPAGSKGWKYKGTGVGADPCKIVLVKPAVIKFVCKDDQLLNPPLLGNSGINLALGTDQYCAEFGGTEVKNVAGLFKHKDAPPPVSCSGPTTTSTSSSSTTSSSIGGPCCGSLTHGVFTSGPAAGTCGTIYNASGTTFAPVVCGGLYFGGGGNAVPLPTITPDLGQTVVELTSCTGQIATVGPTTSTETGSPLNCSSPGCFFGGPLSIPNAATTPTSTCLLVTVTTSVSGNVNCSAGTQDISLPTQSAIYLTGDGETDPGDSIAGIQPCPLCNGGDPMTPGSGSCIGGPNNGMACTPGDTNQSGAALGYPTSHDCPPEPSLLIGTIPNNLAPTTGTVSWTGNIATNDSGSTASAQQRVFAGYCHDNALPGGTSSFDADIAPGNQFKQCWENGMAVGTPCSEADNSAESCEQREHGAYGPGGGAVRTITVFGTPAGPVVDGAPHAQKLVTNFSVPPTFDATVDASANLPGPGTLALTGTTELCSSANPCPDGP
jgi:hypothetical protein